LFLVVLIDRYAKAQCIGRYITLTPALFYARLKYYTTICRGIEINSATVALTVAYEKESNRCSLEQTTRNWPVRDANAIERDHP